MRTLRLILLYIFAVVIVVILGGFVGWYFFLHVPQTNTEAIDTARGLGLPKGSFTGGSTQKNIGTIVGSGPEDVSTSTAPKSPLWHVDTTPVAGMGFVKHATSTALHYVERANGFVFMANPAPRSVTRITETLMPKIYEAFISSDGAVIERSLNDAGAITTFMATVGATTSKASTSTEQNMLLGTYIEKDILQIAPSPTARSIFYIVRNAAGGVDGMTAQWNGSKAKKIFSSTITHWLPQWLSDGRLIITESPADDLPGYGYRVGDDGSMTLLVGNVPGLSLLPRASSKALVYSSSSGGMLTLFTQGAASSTPTALDLHTIADKCVWYEGRSLIAYCAVPSSPTSGTFLNDWYRGAVHTTDEWWKIDIQNGAIMQIYSPKKSDGVNTDVERPIIDPSGNYIAFINASDKSLWMLKIPQ